MNMKIRFLLALFIFSISLARSSGDYATLSGYVRDKINGEPLPYANVYVAGTTIGGSTNTSGYYAIPNIPFGKQLVRFSLIGYRDQTIEIDVDSKKDFKKNVELVSRAVEVSEVVVSAEKIADEKNIQTSRIVVQAKDIASLPAIGETDVFRALQLLPGVKAASDISSGLYIRGGGPDQNLILLDGTVLYNPSHLFGFFSTFNNDAVKDIELFKGGFPAEYGGRLSAVLNVTNKDGDRVSTHGKGSVSLISSRLTAEGPLASGSWFLSGRRTYLDRIVAIMGLNKGKNPLPLYYFYDANGKINQDVSENDKISFVGYLGQDNLDFNQGDGQISVNLAWGNRTGAMKYTHIFNPTLFSNFVITASAFKTGLTAEFSGSKAAFENTVSDYSIKGDIDYYAANEHFIKVGFWWSQYRFGIVRKFGDNVFYDIVFRPALISLYAQDDWTVDERWSFQGGLRFEYQDASKVIKVGPRFSGRYNMTDLITVKAATGIYYQYLNLVSNEAFSFFDMWIPIDEKMKTPRSMDYVLGIETHPYEDYDFNIETYYKTYANIGEFKQEATQAVEINELFDIGKGRAYGAEFFLQKKSGNVTGYIGYSLSWTYRNFAAINEGNDFQPKYDRRHDVSVIANYRLAENWKLGAVYTYATGQTYTEAVARYILGTRERQDAFILPGEQYNRRLEPYHRLDVSITKHTTFLGVTGNWYVQIFNVYNHRNVWFKQFDTSQNPTQVTDVRLLPIIPTFGLDFEF
jgi:CarboxypepD_reg-like domain/TonB-dependent Receptor Plug Domain/TonB dependent receptor